MKHVTKLYVHFFLNVSLLYDLLLILLIIGHARRMGEILARQD